MIQGVWFDATMNRRTFLKLAGSGLPLLIAGPCPAVARTLTTLGHTKDPGCRTKGCSIVPAMPDPAIPDTAIKDRLIKSRLFNHWFSDDIVLSPTQLKVLRSSLARLKRLQRLVGFGNFYLLGFDEARTYAKSYARVGAFTTAELGFLEKIFYYPADAYGFMGEKPIIRMTGKINRSKVTKVRGTGNYLYKGQPAATYQQIKTQVGKDVVLTSGIRGVMKQFLLFLNKADSHQGNLSLASRSLAPPGYSFHGAGDFDVGERGFGVDNFTEKFTRTRVYSRLTDLGFIKFRYTQGNHLGVRFEPWHVEVG